MARLPLEEMEPEDRQAILGLYATLEQLQAEERTLRQAIELIESRARKRSHYVPDENARQRGTRRRPDSIVDYTLRVLQSDPHREWDCYAVFELLQAEDQWRSRAEDPINGVRTALARLADRG